MKKQIIKTLKSRFQVIVFLLMLVLLIPHDLNAAENTEHLHVQTDMTANMFPMLATKTRETMHNDEPEYEASIEVECEENWAFSKYDVDVYVDDSFEGTVDHGTTETFAVTLTKGIYEIRFVNTDDDEVMGATEIDIHQDESLKYKISCTSDEIEVETIVGTIPEYEEDEAPIPQSASAYKSDNYENVHNELTDVGFDNITFEILYDIVFGWTDEGEVESISIDGKTDFEKYDIFKKDAPIVITYHMKEEDDPTKPDESELAKTSDVEGDSLAKPVESESAEISENEEESSVFYSTNSYEIAKEGNSGIFSYRSEGKFYDIYWIIDFDEGYVYYFTHGEGESWCDRLRIDSGTLNDKVTITYHDGNDV